MSVVEPPLSEVLKNIDGFDPVAGLKYVGGHERVYASVLKRFVSLYEQSQWPPSTATASDTLRAAAHHLRGAAATVGASRVAEMAGALQAACSAQADPVACNQMTSDVQHSLLALTAELRERLKNQWE